MDQPVQKKRPFPSPLQQKLVRLLELPSDVVFDLPKIILIGNVQLILENHRGIIEYSPERIRIAVSLGELVITGRQLVITHINKEEISLDGMIAGLQCVC